MEHELLSTAFKMTVSLGAVLLTFGVGVLVAKKLAGSSKSFLKKGTRDNIKPLEVLAHQSLGPGKGLYLIRCLDKKYLVASTNSQINHIANIQEAEGGDEESYEESSTSAENFKSSLSEALDDGGKLSIKDKLSSTLRNISRV